MSDGLEERVAAIEERLRMESGLRASGDRDLGDMAQTVRAQHHLIQALSITQSQHTELLHAQGDAIEALRREHTAKLDQIITMLTSLIDQPGGPAGQ
ncbi:hypothetical protein [Mangrovihabitans endophyticus]|uniref:Uncharacterized protein n=1 Tax=Mangrovihabitans endophyticus TaxID=1751298 RepID=A0A8J3C7V4_9ACTN|nr:hypothetical protein [Mangrovihabitans endophyticus]GGL17876.1 hypothetical protein GCM10012284_60670 [Mangrovihabitans endophyticus]